MARLLLSLCLLCLTSCTVISGDASTGKYSYASVGGNVTNYAQTSSGVTAAAIDNASGFRELNKSARFGIGAAAVVGIAKDLSASYTATTNAKTAAGVNKAAGAEATKQAGIAADVSKAKIAAESAPVATSALDPLTGLNLIK